MKYEIVTLPEQKIAGVSVETGNAEADMGQKIGSLWQRLYGGLYEKLENKVDGYSVGLYDAYKPEGGYRVTVGAKVKAFADDNFTHAVIPAGRYARFKLKGHVHHAVAQAWGEIWQDKTLERSFTGDFEEYREGTPEDCDIYIYIALKD